MTSAKKAPSKAAKAAPAAAPRAQAQPVARTPASAAPPARAKPAPKPPKKVKRTEFDAKTLAAIRAGLEQQRIELGDQLEEIEQSAFKSSQSEISGEVGYDHDEFADAGSATFERERYLSIANNLRDLLDKINKALSKIDEGSYGLCESCGEPVSAERLKALPHVLMCINCKKAEERR